MLIEDTYVTLTPIACKFCGPPTKFVTYIEFDLVLHLHEIHGIGRGYLDTPPTPSIPSNSWLDDSRIRDTINEAIELGHELDDDSVQKLDQEYSKYLEKTSTATCKKSQVSIHAEAYGYNFMQGIRPWSQLVRTKNSFTFMPVVSVDEFFKDDHDKPYSALRSHSLEQSPCYPIIGAKSAGRHIMYYCEVCHPEFANDSAVANINLSCIEHHCKYKDPDRHKAEIFKNFRTGLNTRRDGVN
jgi:hypothetical protein